MIRKRSQIWQEDSGISGLGFWKNPDVFKPWILRIRIVGAMFSYFEYAENAETVHLLRVWRIEYLETSGNPRENISKLVPKDSDHSGKEYIPKVAKNTKKCL